MVVLYVCEEDHDYLINMVLVGEPGVGKSSILRRFVDDAFYENTFSTLGIDFRWKHINIDTKIVKMRIWEAGNPCDGLPMEAYYEYYKQKDIFVIVYDGPDSMDKITKYVHKIEEFYPLQRPHILLLENKSDVNDYSSITSNAFYSGYKRKIERQYDIYVPFGIIKICEMYCGLISTGKTFAMENEWLFAKCSAKMNSNINEAFIEVAKKAIEDKIRESKRASNDSNCACCIL